MKSEKSINFYGFSEKRLNLFGIYLNLDLILLNQQLEKACYLLLVM